MAVFEKLHEDNFEQIVFCHDRRVGLKSIISIHNSALGPATGGCRMWDYKSEEDALYDVLRLSKGMTYKASISGLSMGGGKSIIIGSEKIKSPELLARYGEFIESLAGRYITAKDVGINANDLRTVKSKTKYILGVEGEKNSSGDPSPVTSWGVYNGMRACAEKAFGKTQMTGLTIALQGLGSVNYYLAKHLAKEGAKLVGCDINQEMIARARGEFEIEIVDPEKIYDVKCDIFSPGALGATINEKTLKRLNCRVIAGAANNQLETPHDGDHLHQKGFIYAPDYAINAGGLINIFHEREGYNKEKAWAQVAGIYDTIRGILDRSERDNVPAYIVADKISLERVQNAEKNKR